MKILCLVWGPFGFRSSELAEAIDAEQVSITLLYGPRYFAPLRYLALFLRSLIMLSRKRPDVIYAQNPPIFCPLTCLLYCRLRGARLLVDHHSIWRVKTLGGGPLSRLIGLLESFVARAAEANTVPHGVWGSQLIAMGAQRVKVIHDFVPRNRFERDEALRRTFTDLPLIAISSHGGHPLERMEVEALSVRSLPSVALLITGPREKLERRLATSELPTNVRYLGFLERETYEKLKASADLALNITDEPFTLSHVLFEFAASSLPIISSRQKVIEEVFGDSIEYLDESTVGEAAARVSRFAEDEPLRNQFKRRIKRKYEEFEAMRKSELLVLRTLFDRP